MFGRCKPRAVRMRKGKTARKGEMQCVICYCAGYDGTKSLGETQQATWQARHLHGDVSRRLQRGTAPRSSPRREKGGRIYLPSGFPSPASHWSSFTPVGRTLPVLWGLSLSSSVARSVLWDVVFYPDLKLRGARCWWCASQEKQRQQLSGLSKRLWALFCLGSKIL